MADRPQPLAVFPVAETRFGQMFTLRGDTVIGRSLRFYGEFAGDEVDSILSLVRDGDRVLDIGANIGFHALGLARKVGAGGSVTAIEPQRFCFQLLCANVTANQMAHVTCQRAAVGDFVGTCAVPLHDPASQHNAGATPVSIAPNADQRSDTVPMITIDSLDLAACNFIKIDTEGFEDRVLAGAQKTLKAHQPTLYVEVHDTEKLRLTAQILRPLGYRLVLHHTAFFRADNPAGEKLSIFAPNAGGSALIALPPGRSLPENLPGKTQVLG